VGAGTAGISWLQATKLHYQVIEVVLFLVFRKSSRLAHGRYALCADCSSLICRIAARSPFEASCRGEVVQPIIECRYCGSARSRRVARSSIINDVNRRRRVAGAILGFDLVNDRLLIAISQRAKPLSVIQGTRMWRHSQG
jgi:hypothetical protein